VLSGHFNLTTGALTAGGWGVFPLIPSSSERRRTNWFAVTEVEKPGTPLEYLLTGYVSDACP
jgi:hypothetical protein